MSDTIFALSSGPAPAGIAVIRLSGPDALPALQSLLLRQPTGSQWVPQPRRAHRRKLYQPTFDTASDPDVLDDALVLYFPGPASFTGEDVVELHCHGGAATIAAVLTALGHYPSCRLAEAGEFSRRAFANGNMDLTEAEALADLISAETEAQRRLALRLATGAGHDRYQDWTDRLIRILALIEAAVDFPEDDLPPDMLDQNSDAIATLIQEWQQDIRLGALSSAIRDGVRVAIVGSPNVGKSSLLNKLAGRDAAIVSEIAGTLLRFAWTWVAILSPFRILPGCAIRPIRLKGKGCVGPIQLRRQLTLYFGFRMTLWSLIRARHLRYWSQCRFSNFSQNVTWFPRPAIGRTMLIGLGFPLLPGSGCRTCYLP